MRKLIVVSLMLILGFSLFATPLAKVYQNDNPTLHVLNDLAKAAGVMPVTSAGPVTGYDLVRLIEVLKTKELSPYAMVKLLEVEKDVTQVFSTAPASMRITVSPELYATTDSQANEWDWMVRYNQRSPFFWGEADAIFANHIYAIISYGLKLKLIPADFQKVTTNYPYADGFGESQMQNSFPHTAFVGLSGKRSALILGRDTLGWGSGNTGNLLVGNHVPYHDFLHASTSNTSLRYTFLAIPMNELNTEGKAKTPENQPGGLFDPLFHNSLSRTFIAHRLEYTPIPQLRISLTEGVLFYVSRADLRMLNPFMFLHNYQNFGEVNNSMSAEVEAVLGRGLSLNFQLFLDQIQTKGEVGDDPSSEIPPNAYAALLGLNYTSFTKKGLFKSYVEAVYTSPYAYIRAGDETGNYYEYVFDGTNWTLEAVKPEEQFNLDFVHAVNMRGGKGSVAFLGYRFGPDTIVGSTGASYEDQRGFAFLGNVMLIVQGDNGLEVEGKTQKVNTDISELFRLSPTGDPTYRLVVTGQLSYDIPLVQGLSVWGRTDVVNTWHKGSYSFDAQVNAGISYSVTLF